MFCPQVGMNTSPVTPQPSYRYLNLSLGYILIINFELGNVIWYGLTEREMGLPYGTGPNSLLTPYPNMYGRGVDTAMMHVGTTASVSSMPPVDLMVSLLEYPKITQSPPPLPLLCGVYPPSGTFSLTLSGSVPHSGCSMLGRVGTLLRQ